MSCDQVTGSCIHLGHGYVVRWYCTSTGFTRPASYISDNSDKAPDISCISCHTLLSCVQSLTSQPILDSHNSDQVSMSLSLLFHKRLRVTMLYSITLIHKHLKPILIAGGSKTLSIPHSSRLTSPQRLDYPELSCATSLYAGSLIPFR